MKPHTDSIMERRTLLLSFPLPYGEVKIQVTQRISNRLISILDLKRVKKFEIKADKKECASILLTVINEDSQQSIEIDFKPFQTDLQRTINSISITSN